MRPRGLLLVLALAVGLVHAPLAAQPADIEAWTTASSPHFEVHSNAAPERAAEIVASLERFRSVFAGLAHEIELRSPAPTKIFAFVDAEAYAPYKNGGEAAGVTVLGQFLSHPDGNYITLNADPSYLGSFAVIFHEYVHFLVQSNFPNVPRWFNEGLAEYYSTFMTEGETVYLGQPVQRHLRWLQRNRELEIESVLGATRETEIANDTHGAGRFYAVSWLLVHYLLSDESDSSDELSSYFAALAQGADSRGAFVDAFGIRPSELEESLREYLTAPSLPVAALSLDGLPGVRSVRIAQSRPEEVLTGLADLLAHMGREEQAARHAHEALSYAPESGDAHAALAYVRDRQQRLREAHELWLQATELVPQQASSYLLQGRHLLTLAEGGGLEGDGSDREELSADARWALGVATEIDPSYGEAWKMLGVSHLLPGGEASDGILALERARGLLPGRSDLLLHLVQLYVRDDRDDQALALAEGELTRIGTPEQVASAHEEIERWGLVRSANAALEAGDVETGIALFDQAISVTRDPALRASMEESLVELRERFEGGR